MRNYNLPTISNYGNYSSYNYGSHTLRVDIPKSSNKKYGITLYYSYDTCVAFRGYIKNRGFCLCVRKNEYSTTTGKHLNWIDGGSNIRTYWRLLPLLCGGGINEKRQSIYN